MQTFLPYLDFEQSAECLDYRRLGKQRVEVLQLLTALTSGPETLFDDLEHHFVRTISPDLIIGETYENVFFDNPLPRYIYKKTPWYNHPAAKMWRGYEQALTDYGLAIIQEWVDRGYKDTCHDKICEIIGEMAYNDDWEPGFAEMPPWLGNKDFHAAHRSNLLRKDPIWYGQFGWIEPDDLPYVWPVS